MIFWEEERERESGEKVKKRKKRRRGKKSQDVHPFKENKQTRRKKDTHQAC